MAFKRAQWHSGLTYKQTCDECGTIVQYTDELLDFRPWFADGFVYCPKCKKPLRHRETYAIEGDKAEQEVQILTKPVDEKTPSGEGFCTQCGKQFRAGDCFCSGCGKKRPE